MKRKQEMYKDIHYNSDYYDGKTGNELNVHNRIIKLLYIYILSPSYLPIKQISKYPCAMTSKIY